jgi:2-polyprenyl-6-methoxyphenol hydroxylase-like FAD-dependent oxidoreductase
MIATRAPTSGRAALSRTSLQDGRRVAGVVYRADGREREVRAPLVIGADGRRSRIADLSHQRGEPTSEAG